MPNPEAPTPDNPQAGRDARPTMITLDEPEVWEDEREEREAASPDPTPPPSPPADDLQAEVDRLRAENQNLDQRLRDNRANGDRLLNENKVAHQLLAEAYRGNNTDSDLEKLGEFVAPQAPTAEQLIENPGLAVQHAEKYARESTDYAVKRMLLELRPALQATATSVPMVNAMAAQGRENAVALARNSLDESERADFDQHVEQIGQSLNGAQNGAVLSLYPKSWIATYRMMTGTKPVRAKAPAPARPSVSSAGDEKTPEATVTLPPYLRALARRTGRDPVEYYKSVEARLGRRPEV